MTPARRSAKATARSAGKQNVRPVESTPTWRLSLRVLRTTSCSRRAGCAGDVGATAPVWKRRDSLCFYLCFEFGTGRREDSDSRQARGTGLEPIPHQPSRVGRYPYLGDLDDALDATTLRELNIKGVLCLCPDRLDREARAGLETARSQGVAIYTVEAHDHSDYDIMTNTWPAAKKLLQRWVSAGVSRILIVCWGGVNRSAALAGAWLRSAENVSFARTMETLMRARGTVPVLAR